MKTHKNIFEKCLDKDVIRTAIIDAAKGKRKRKDVKIVLANNVNVKRLKRIVSKHSKQEAKQESEV